MNKAGIVSAIAAVAACGTLAADKPPRQPTRLCVVWSSADPEVATDFCFMYTLNAKRAGWKVIAC